MMRYDHDLHRDPSVCDINSPALWLDAPDANSQDAAERYAESHVWDVSLWGGNRVTDFILRLLVCIAGVIAIGFLNWLITPSK